MHAICLTALVAAFAIQGQPPAARSFTMEAALLANDVLRALQGADGAREVLLSVKLTGEPIVDLLETMTARRKAISRIKQARVIMSSHLQSKHDATKQTGEAFDTVFAGLEAAWVLGLSVDERLVKARTEEAATATVPDASKAAADADEAWRLLPVAVSALTFALIDDTRLVDGKLRYLRITAAQRASLVLDTQKAFPKSLLRNERHAVDVAARLLREWLRGDWKASDEK